MSANNTRTLTGKAVLAMMIAFFGTVAAANGIMMRYAISTMPGLEVDSAYSASLAYQKEIARARSQDQRNWSVTAHVARAGDSSAVLELDVRDAGGKPLSGLDVTCRLERPADRRADVAASLEERSAGRYGAHVSSIASGQWDLITESRSAGELLFTSKNRVILE